MEIRKCETSEQWDKLVRQSRQGTPFCYSSFLETACDLFDRWLVFDDKRLVAGVVIPTSLNGEAVTTPVPHSMYLGFLMAELKETEATHASVPKTLTITTTLIDFLIQKYSHFSLQLHPTLTDVRPFLWHDYDNPDKNTFQITPAFTGIVDTSKFATFEDYLHSIRYLRQREYKKATKLGLEVQKCDLNTLVLLYRKTFERQDIEVSDGTIQRVKKIAQAALADGYGELWACIDNNNDPLSASLFLKHNVSAYYLLGANDPRGRSTGAGTFLMLSVIDKFFHQGIHLVDMVGVNSPKRGDYKVSFNAEITPYFQMTWQGS